MCALEGAVVVAEGVTRGVVVVRISIKGCKQQLRGCVCREVQSSWGIQKE